MAVPFLKWVGGKTQLLSEIHKRLPERFNDYFEPFIGGGSVFFSLTDIINGNNSVTIGDFNEELTNVYETVKNNPQCLIDMLSIHKTKISKDYYQYPP